MCFVFIWEQTATCTTYSMNWLVFITEMKSVYCAVRTGSLNKAVCASYLKGLKFSSLENFQTIHNIIASYVPVICVAHTSTSVGTCPTICAIRSGFYVHRTYCLFKKSSTAYKINKEFTYLFHSTISYWLQFWITS